MVGCMFLVVADMTSLTGEQLSIKLKLALTRVNRVTTLLQARG